MIIIFTLPTVTSNSSSRDKSSRCCEEENFGEHVVWMRTRRRLIQCQTDHIVLYHIHNQWPRNNIVITIIQGHSLLYHNTHTVCCLLQTKCWEEESIVKFSKFVNLNTYVIFFWTFRSSSFKTNIYFKGKIYLLIIYDWYILTNHTTLHFGCCK